MQWRSSVAMEDDEILHDRVVAACGKPVAFDRASPLMDKELRRSLTGDHRLRGRAAGTCPGACPAPRLLTRAPEPAFARGRERPAHACPPTTRRGRDAGSAAR